MMDYTVKTHAAAADAARIISRINPVEIVTATNVAEEKAKWIANFSSSDSITDPTLTYSEVGDTETQEAILANFAALVKRLPTHSANDELMSRLIQKRISEALLALKLKSLIAEGDREAEMSEIIQSIYGHPSGDDVNRAYDMIERGHLAKPEYASRFTPEEQKILKTIELNAAGIQYWFDQVLAWYGIEGWEIEVSDRFTSIDVRDKDSSGGSIVGIPTDRKVDGLKLLELIGHEIESHLRGSENCRALIRQLLGGPDSVFELLVPVLAKSDNELLYEGVAKHSDISVNGTAGYALPWATIAIHQALKGASFAEVARTVYGARLTVGENAEKAKASTWLTVYRAMRGGRNLTAKAQEKAHYAFTKDYCYLAGVEYVKGLPAIYHDFSSMTVQELDEIMAILGEIKPAYPKKDAVGWVAEQLLRSTP